MVGNRRISSQQHKLNQDETLLYETLERHGSLNFIYRLLLGYEYTLRQQHTCNYWKHFVSAFIFDVRAKI